jgi:cytochrome b561
MSLMNTQTEYGSISKFFHWFIFSLVVLMICIGFGADYGLFTSKEVKHEIVNIHKLMGIFISLLIMVILFWKLINPKPKLSNHWLTRFAASFMHFFLYLTLIAMTLSGWIMSTAAGKFPDFFGILFPFPGIPSDQPLADLAFEAHEYLAWILIVLILLHVSAALKHYYIDKDNVLQRMLPFRKNKKNS